jgi:hypothetical protein
LRDLGLAVDRLGVDTRLGIGLDLGDRTVDRCAFGLGQLGVGEEGVGVELTLEKGLGKALL